jgi:hypothetical protein
MGGLIFIFIFGLWLTVCIYWARQAPEWFGVGRFKWVVSVLFFTLLLPLPLVDEIVGGWQFKKLCEANVVRVNKETARGRMVYYDLGGYEVPVPGTWVKVWKMSSRYLDVTTGELVLSFDHFRAEGGHLFPGFDSGHDPLTFKGECHPPDSFNKNFVAGFGLTQIDKPPGK